MSTELTFASAEKKRDQLTLAQQKKIKSMYTNLSKDISKQAKSLSTNENISSALKKAYLEDMNKNISSTLKGINKNIEATIKGSMQDTAQAIVSSAQDNLKSVGLQIKGAYSFVPTDIVETIATGQLYNADWSLSKSIWRAGKKVNSDINTIIAEGVAANRSSFDIAKDLEKYVNPSAAKPWDWGKIYPGVNKQVDYNAQRLARTMVSHAYQESFVRVTKDNPFFERYKWLASNHANVCELCAQRANQLFKKDELPLDHPNGRCTFVVVMEKSMSEVKDEIADWYNSPEGKYPDLDKFVRGTGGTITKKPVLKKMIEATAMERFQRTGIKAFDFTGIPDEVQASLYTTTEKLNDKFPAMKEYFELGGTEFYARSAEDMGKTGMSTGLNLRLETPFFKINSEYAGSLDDLIDVTQSMVSSEWSMPCAEELYADYMFTHEYGHALFNEMTQSTLAFSQVKEEILAGRRALEKNFYEEIVEIASKKDPHFNVNRHISRYGQSDYGEFFAEAFANSQCGESNAIGDAMAEFLKRKGVTK